MWHHHLQRHLSFTNSKLIYVTYFDTLETWSNNNLHTNLCLLEISSGLGLQPTGTSRKLSSRLSTVTELMWMTWKLGAIPPLCFSLNQDIYSCHKLIFGNSLFFAGEQIGLQGFHDFSSRVKVIIINTLSNWDIRNINANQKFKAPTLWQWVQATQDNKAPTREARVTVFPPSGLCQCRKHRQKSSLHYHQHRPPCVPGKR